MIFDAATDRSAVGRRFDVCVIGSGPAGMTLARRLAAAGADVALMEAGGLDLSDEFQDALPGRERRPRLLPPRHLPAALLRRLLEPLGRLVPRASTPVDFAPSRSTR